MTQLYEKVGIKYRVSPVPYALRHFDPHMLLIAATRYFIGRMTIATCHFAQDELAKAWPHIPQKTRAIIRRDLEEAFRDDDRDREQGASTRTMGWDCDRKAWEGVRAAWQTDAVQPAPAPISEDAPSISPLSIADRLEALSEQMLNIATEMDYFGGFSLIGQNGKHLAGAAVVAQSWADGIREDYPAEDDSALEQPTDRSALQAAGTHPAPGARHCESNAYQIEIRRISAERDALAARLDELERQEPVAWIYDWQAPEGPIRDWVTTNHAEIPKHTTNIRPLFARPSPALPAHIFRELVNDLRDIATQWHGSQQLRERISGRLRQDASPAGTINPRTKGD